MGDCIVGGGAGDHPSLNTDQLMTSVDCGSTKVPEDGDYVLRITNYWDTGSDSCPDGSWTWEHVFGVGYLCAENAYDG